ncbi:hypothetical protein [Phenylobacterium sp.]|uniref:hypothetical protein n=1 Tax=Phenylobacterium sp. TaxID=1871053 RepID=UPI00356A41E9
MDPQTRAALPFVLFPWLCLCAMAAASAAWRSSHGLPVITGRPADAVFYQGWASARSRRNLFTLAFHANNCITVAVTPAMLVILPHFPFNLLFVPSISDLEHYVPRAAVRVSDVGWWMFRRWVRVKWIGEDGRQGVVDLALRDPDAFLATLGPSAATVSQN